MPSTGNRYLATAASDAHELAERAVASQLNNPAAVLGHERPDQLLAESFKAPKRAGLVTPAKKQVRISVRVDVADRQRGVATRWRQSDLPRRVPE